MRVLGSLLLLSALLIIPATAKADVIFTDGFNAGTPGLSVTQAGNFHTINGTNVDLLGPGPGDNNYSSLCTPDSTGQQCVDLGGTDNSVAPNDMGDLVSDMTFGPGQYLFNFFLTGPGRGVTSATTLVTFGDYNQSITLTTSQTDSVSVVVTVTGTSVISFVDLAPPGNQAAILDNVSVATPEPSGLFLLGSGLLTGVGLLKRRLP